MFIALKHHIIDNCTMIITKYTHWSNTRSKTSVY